MEKDLRSQIEEMARAVPLPAEKGELLEKAYLEVAQAGITERVPKAGEAAPDFRLPNAVGIPVSLLDARAHGPVVVTFYRGIW